MGIPLLPSAQNRRVKYHCQRMKQISSEVERKSVKIKLKRYPTVTQSIHKVLRSYSQL